MNWFQSLFIENESKQTKMAKAAERAAANAGYNISVKSDGSIKYNDRASYEDQDGVQDAIRTDVECVL